MTLLVVLFTFMLYQFYSASIVASLLMEPPRTITDLKSLFISKLNILIEDVSYNHDFFLESPNPTVKRIYNDVLVPRGLKNVFVTPKIGLEKVEAGGYAFQVDVSLGYQIIREKFSERSICDLCEILLFPPKPIMPLLRKHSQYRQIITYGLRKLEESGIMKYQKSVWYARKPECSPGVANEPSSMLEIYDGIHNWLMVGSDLNFAKDLLQTAELRLDSEVLLVLKKYLKHELWPLYDVYNPGSTIGGAIKASFYGYWKPFSNGKYHNNVTLLKHQGFKKASKNSTKLYIFHGKSTS
ncbi:ionotropic receptor 75a-like [Arctopsyche grandis]|uniref:ionotropic receptor 75a-like n=1 Tax=Arctopsyche grandis TaxID=121162 RepID=UPI00406D8A3C